MDPDPDGSGSGRLVADSYILQFLQHAGVAARRADRS